MEWYCKSKLLSLQNLDKHEDVQSACEAFNESRKKDLHALTTLDREAPYRLGARGRFDIKYLARTILQLKVQELGTSMLLKQAYVHVESFLAYLSHNGIFGKTSGMKSVAFVLFIC